jgi:hypothetical protein
MSMKFMIILILLAAAPARADWNDEKVRIDYLIHEVEQVQGSFIRNGREYMPAEAAAHLKMKLERAMGSWFAPDKDHWTAELFIETIASKSSISGKPYQIKFDTGQTVEARDWLRNRLNEYSITQDIQERSNHDDENIEKPRNPK